MDTPNIIREVPPNLPANSWIGIDTEIFQMDKNRLHRPTTGKFACLTIATDENTVYFIDDERKVAPALEKIKDCVWCFSNAKFDLTQLRRWEDVKPRKKIFDTQLVEQILYSGFFDSFSLKAVTRRYLGEVIEKETRDEFSTASEFTQEMVEYSVLDPVLSLMVAKKQKDKMQPSDIKIWTEIDRPALWAFLDFDGFCIDVPGWLKLAETNKQRQEEIKSRLPINPNSPKQILDKLNKLGFKLKSTGEEELIEQIEKHPDVPAVELAREILNARMYGKRASTYGFNFVNDHIETDEFGNQMVFADYRIIGAETGRVSCTAPAMQTIPVKDTKEFRELFIPKKGHKLIIADYSSQEPRLTALRYQEPLLLEWFRDGKDVYVETARSIFKREMDKKSSERKQMKSTVLGLDYGMSEYGLARKEGISVEEARRLIEKVFKLFPVFAKGIEKQRKETLQVTTLFGRKIWLNPYGSQCERNALNAPDQGGAADVMKASLGRLHQEWPEKFGKFGVVGYIHDELAVSSPTEIAEDVAKFVQFIMQDQAEKMTGYQIPFPVEVSIGNSWADK